MGLQNSSLPPNVEGCLDNIREKIGLQIEMKSFLSKITFKSGLPFFGRENFVNNVIPELRSFGITGVTVWNLWDVNLIPRHGFKTSIQA